MLYEFQLIVVTKNICCTESRRHSWSQYSNEMVQEILLVLLNFNDQERSGRYQTSDSAAVLQAIEANLMTRTSRISGELSIS